ncbi:MAG: hypothetical protein QXP02_05145 [Desulfurococcaceae archaeon]
MHEIKHGEAVLKELDELRELAIVFIQYKLGIPRFLAEMMVNNTIMIHNLLVDYARYLGIK